MSITRAVPASSTTNCTEAAKISFASNTRTHASTKSAHAGTMPARCGRIVRLVFMLLLSSSQGQRSRVRPLVMVMVAYRGAPSTISREKLLRVM